MLDPTQLHLPVKHARSINTENKETEWTGETETPIYRRDRINRDKIDRRDRRNRDTDIQKGQENQR